MTITQQQLTSTSEDPEIMTIAYLRMNKDFFLQLPGIHQLGSKTKLMNVTLHVGKAETEL